MEGEEQCVQLFTAKKKKKTRPKFFCFSFLFDTFFTGQFEQDARVNVDKVILFQVVG
jgi:hypothetical protein